MKNLFAKIFRKSETAKTEEIFENIFEATTANANIWTVWTKHAPKNNKGGSFGYGSLTHW